MDHKLIRATKPSQCYGNSAMLAILGSRRARYVEGYAMSDVGVPLAHAWCVDADDGGVVDVTWPWGAHGYDVTKGGLFGVELPTALVRERALSPDAEMPCIDAWKIGWPLLQQPYDPLDATAAMERAVQKLRNNRGARVLG